MKKKTESIYTINGSDCFGLFTGSAKGVTAAKVKNRKYIRNRGYGGSVRTSDQAQVKAKFKRLTTMWRSLTNEQILAWNKLALSQEAKSKGKISIQVVQVFQILLPLRFHV